MMPGLIRATALLLLLLPGVAAGQVQLHGASMGSTWSVSLAQPPADPVALRAGIVALLTSVVAQMSTWEPASDISRFNALPAGKSLVLKPEFFVVLSQALELAQRSDGAFDPTVGPLVQLWGFGPGDGAHPRLPASDALEAAKQRVGWQKLQLDRHTRRLAQPGGVQLDLSGLAPGFAADLIARYLHGQQIDDFLIDVGGELRASGVKAHRQPWVVAIEAPEVGEGPPWGTVVLDGQALATSGDYRRYFEFRGQRFAHIIDPRSGAPVAHALVSVSVLAPTAMQADALATALSVLGPDAGMQWARRKRLAVLMLVQEGENLSARMTAGFEAALTGSR